MNHFVLKFTSFLCLLFLLINSTFAEVNVKDANKKLKKAVNLIQKEFKETEKTIMKSAKTAFASIYKQFKDGELTVSEYGTKTNELLAKYSSKLANSKTTYYNYCITNTNTELWFNGATGILEEDLNGGSTIEFDQGSGKTLDRAATKFEKTFQYDSKKLWKLSKFIVESFQTGRREFF
jgi:hypothetical protein